MSGLLFLASVSNGEDWTAFLPVKDADTGLPWDLTGKTVEVSLSGQFGGRGLLLTSAGGYISVVDAGILFNVPAAIMRGLEPGGFDIIIRLTDPISGAVTIAAKGKIVVTNGSF